MTDASFFSGIDGAAAMQLVVLQKCARRGDEARKIPTSLVPKYWKIDEGERTVRKYYCSLFSHERLYMRLRTERLRSRQSSHGRIIIYAYASKTREQENAVHFLC